MGTAYGTAEADPARSSIFPEQAAGTAVPAAASRGLSLMLACLQQKPDGPGTRSAEPPQLQPYFRSLTCELEGALSCLAGHLQVRVPAAV
jgi:hypothetical protein